jgi:hypothetical protein
MRSTYRAPVAFCVDSFGIGDTKVNAVRLVDA